MMIMKMILSPLNNNVIVNQNIHQKHQISNHVNNHYNYHLNQPLNYPPIPFKRMTKLKNNLNNLLELIVN